MAVSKTESSANSKPKWQTDLKSSFKKFKKTMSKDNIKQKLSKKPSSELGIGKENAAVQSGTTAKKGTPTVPPPMMPLQTALANKKTQEPKSIPKSPLAVASNKTVTPFSSPEKTAGTPTKKTIIDSVTKSPVVMAKEIIEEVEEGKGSSSTNNNKLVKCTRVLGVAILLFCLKNAIGFGKRKV